jgi:hypothetical protein
MYINQNGSAGPAETINPFGSAPSADNKAGAVLHLKAIPSAKVDDLFHGKI